MTKNSRCVVIVSSVYLYRLDILARVLALANKRAFVGCTRALTLPDDQAVKVITSEIQKT